jgi:APA family basic amino acid/polyamine antiporter
MPRPLAPMMGLPHATAMVVGTILGASIFVQPSEISRHVASVAGMMLVWLAAGALTLCGALVCAELAAAFPETGGVYVFLRRLYSPAAGFLWGWAMFWSVHSGIIAALALVFARYAAFFVPLEDAGVRGVAVGAVLALSAVNYFGVRPGSALQLVLTAAKLAAVALILVLFFALGGGRPAPPEPVPPPPVTAGEFALGVAAALFAYGGWHMVTYAAGETRAAWRTVPRALLLGTLTVTACYLALNAAYLYVLPPGEVAASARVAADAAQALLGPRGGAAISALVLLSVFGALSGIVLAGPRVYYAMAGDGLAFRWMGAVHPRFATPHLAIVLQAVWASLLVATDTYRGLFSRVIYTEWLFFALLGMGIFRLRRAAPAAALGAAGEPPRFRAWGYPAVPAIFVAAALGIVASHIVASPGESLTGLLLVALGLPVYSLWRHSRRKRGSDDHH